MADAPTSFDYWGHVLASERDTIREPDGRHDGPNRPLTGLAFSGGGIRSATFNYQGSTKRSERASGYD